MVWTIIIIKNKKSNWYTNYINEKLGHQINAFNLANDVNIVLLDNINYLKDYLPTINSQYVSVINEPIEIADNYISKIYYQIKYNPVDGIGMRGMVFVGKNKRIFNQISEKYDAIESYVPITKWNPIKKSIIQNNIHTYINRDDLSDMLFARNTLQDILVTLEKPAVFASPLGNQAISFCVPAYHMEEYIEECLDSISKQNCYHEILVGVDACESTLTAVKKIKRKYPTLRIFWFPENMGTYVVKNTLATYAQNDVLCFFDADDIMYKDYANIALKELTDESVFRVNYRDFTATEIKEVNYFSYGNFTIYKKDFFALNGYWSERIASDLDFIKRSANAGYTHILNENYLMNRRLHSHNISFDKNIGMNTPVRQKLHKEIDTRQANNVTANDRLITAPCVEIKSISISFCISAYKSAAYIEECLNSVQAQPCEKEILVGVDACDITLRKLTDIRHKYKNLRIFWFSKNVGTSVVKNTLATFATCDILSFFDSDDIMSPEYSTHVLNNINGKNIVRFRYHSFGSLYDDKKMSTEAANGIMSIWRDNFFKLNGFWEHRITEDLDFIQRWSHLGEDVDLPVIGFERRVHANNISMDANKGCFTDYGIQLTKLANQRIADRQYINKTLITANCQEIHMPLIDINKYFDKIYCINLDRRQDKWNIVSKKFDKLEIQVERFSGIDGNTIPTTELAKYNTINKYEVGCMLSHYRIIQDAKVHGYKRILILEDDILFIENFNQVFSDKIGNFPEWRMLYLGATQYQWNDLEFGDGFYYSKHNDGTFAYAVDQSIYDDILGGGNVNNKPIDYKLWDIQAKHYKKCYTLFPSLIISDVSTSDIRSGRNNVDHQQRVKGNLAKYE
jgi:glycosyltransferase involved in cell wall biosynthesis